MLIVLAALVVMLLGAVQIGSDAVFARAAQPPALPAALAPSTGTAIYRVLARISQAPYVDDMLARAALDRGDLALARRYAIKLPDAAKRNALLGRVAQARGDWRAAQMYYVRAGDIEAIARAVDELAPANPARAYALENALKERLAVSGTHPDAVAEAYWRLGQLAAQQGKRGLSMHNYAQAVALSPLSEKYLISAGFNAYQLHDDSAAQRYFSRALSVDPASADAYAGAGMTALRQGDRATATRDAQRARAADPHSHALSTLEQQLNTTP